MRILMTMRFLKFAVEAAPTEDDAAFVHDYRVDVPARS
jgi:hypothetical protein